MLKITHIHIRNWGDGCNYSHLAFIMHIIIEQAVGQLNALGLSNEAIEERADIK